jgi:cytochrome c oxidase subunit 1
MIVVLSMGAVFGMFAAFYYWVGKMTGFQYPENLGVIHFWSTFVGLQFKWFNCYRNRVTLTV